MSELKGFLDYSADDLRDGLTEGYYLLEITEAKGAEWDDGAIRLDIRTKVAEGKDSGKFGPMHTFNYGAAGGVTKDGREWSVTEEESRTKLRKQLNSVTDGDLKNFTLSDEMNINRTMMDEIATQIIGRQFIAMVAENDNGYDVIRRFHGVSSPPKKYQPTTPKGGKGFTI